ncbi:hypothetical protein MKW94_021697, partial [Papaver nudicaule]|nr:hypothetical protein [Papaver nudicaule]
YRTMSCSKPKPPHMQVALPKETLKILEDLVKGSPAVPIQERCIITEEELEDNRRRNQARLASRLKRDTACRLLGEDQSKTANVSATRSLVAIRSDLSYARFRKQQSLHQPKNHWVFRLENINLFFGNAVTSPVRGTLEARGSGFTFTATRGSGFPKLRFKDTDVKRSFFQCGDKDKDKDKASLLQFHMCHPIMVGSKETNNILFLLQDWRPVDDLQKFIASFSRAQWDSQSWFRGFYDLDKLQFDGVFYDLDERQFDGVFNDAGRVSFSLIDNTLVVLYGWPFRVFPLTDVEIVNLAHLEPGFRMTVVFKDFSLKVLEISEIDECKLNSIKDFLDFWNVKYYCNRRFINWNSILRGIVERPERFVQSGGWESLNLEDEHTLRYYIADEPGRKRQCLSHP